MAQNFHAAGRNIHPADDKTARWKLEYLFKEDLKAPTFLGIEFSNSNYKLSDRFVQHSICSKFNIVEIWNPYNTINLKFEISWYRSYKQNYMMHKSFDTIE
jgi:hypothetical protein